MNNQSNDGELRDYLTKEITCGRAISYDTLQFYGTLSVDDKNRCTAIDNIAALLQAEILKARIAVLNELDMDVLKPCEPDCDDIRHARHEGSWDAHILIERKIDDLESQLTDKESKDA